MISWISGWFISFYADDLAELIIDDILLETAKDLNEIETKTWKVYVGEESKVIAEDMIMMINNF